MMQRRILVYSIMYYRLSESCISDSDYDDLSYQLVALQNEAGEEVCKKTRYWHAFYDFDGHTGFHLSRRLSTDEFWELEFIARLVRSYWHENVSAKDRALMTR